LQVSCETDIVVEEGINMPSRLVSLLIILFWLGSTCWLVMREIAPGWRTGEPPTIVFDLTDEVGANTTDWSAHHGDKAIGFGFNRIRRLPNRRFELHSEFKFQDFALFGLVQLKKLGTTLHVTDDARLLSMQIQVNTPDHELKIQGTVNDSELSYNFLLDEQEIKLLALKPIHLDPKARVLNPMHLVNKIAGLYPGQRWSIPLIDPSEAIGEAALKPLLQAGPRTSLLIAEVKLEELSWQDEDVPCYRIDYAPPGEKHVATTWVRRSDGLVLQQDAQLLGQSLKLRREPRQR
jgi:hypothetical protein